MTDHPTGPSERGADGAAEGADGPATDTTPVRDAGGPDVQPTPRSASAPSWLDDGAREVDVDEVHDGPGGPTAAGADTQEVAPVDGAAAVAVDDDDVASDDADDQPDWEARAADDPRSRGELLAAVHEASASRDDYLDGLQRKQAEFENFRRRMQQQASQQRVAGHADVASRVLEVLDDFDRTLTSIATTTADDGVVKGVALVRDKLVAALREVGLERVDDTGQPFDPTRHEAVQQVPGEGIVGDDGEPVVAEVLRPGYVLGPRVLRAAMVAVAQ